MSEKELVKESNKVPHFTLHHEKQRCTETDPSVDFVTDTKLSIPLVHVIFRLIR